MSQTSAFFGAIRYEFAMQLRRRAMWIGLGMISALLFFILGVTTGKSANTDTSLEALGYMASGLTFLLPIGAGLLLANRVPRDRSLRVEELLCVAPASGTTRLIGKYLGATLAVSIPILLIQLAQTAYIANYFQDVSVFPRSLAMFLIVTLPTICFVGAFALAFTTFLWPPLFQFLFVGYWIWANGNPDDLPFFTPNGTLISANGDFALKGFFDYGLPSQGLSHTAVTPGLALANLAVILGLAAVALMAASGVQSWRYRSA
jgi:ABC-type transport system involved in multi-copper enzyme maturation permease subunit